MPESLLSVAEAQAIILGEVHPLPPTPLPLAAASGLVLAQDVVSDLDMPPYDKALMDGYAVRAADVGPAGAALVVIEEVTAGSVPKKTVGAGEATRIMTGAPMPPGADAVVMIERTTALSEQRVTVEGGVKPGQNILPRAREMRSGDVVLQAGMRLRPQELGLLAMCGAATVRVHPSPRVAILPTGDEIVEVEQTPGPGQIRNSNGFMLLGQTVRAGAEPAPLGIARDNRPSLQEHVARGLEADALILSGGVSAGKLDLVPAALAEAGVAIFFHKVAMKPGKPMLFGVKRHEGRPATFVFGLPGNPVSSLVCFELFVRPALRRLMNLPPGPTMVQAALAEDFPYRSDRPTYHPAQLTAAESGWSVRAMPWFGSADLRGLMASNAFVVLPPGDHRHRAGQTLPVLVVENQGAL
jgi:molybdopterin molybdotransferase